MPVKLKGNVYITVVRQAIISEDGTWETTPTTWSKDIETNEV